MRVFLDFDGTVSRGDVVDTILETYADPAWRQVEQDWQAGRIGSRECLRQQMALVRASEDEMNALLDRVELDGGFVGLLEMCVRHGVPVHIVSDGFDYCIQRILRRAGPDIERLLSAVRVCASHLEPCGDRQWRVDFPFFTEMCVHGCATCKPAAMSFLGADDRGPNVFVGDGLSDRYAASAADEVFAKDALASYCRQEAIACRRYKDLRQVASSLEKMLRDRAILLSPERITRGNAWAR